MQFKATFRDPKTRQTVARIVEAPDANGAMDVIWAEVGPVGSLMVSAVGSNPNAKWGD